MYICKQAFPGKSRCSWQISSECVDLPVRMGRNTEKMRSFCIVFHVAWCVERHCLALYVAGQVSTSHKALNCEHLGNKKTPLSAIDNGVCQTEEEGFEPPVPCGTAVFKTATLSHSVTPPAFLHLGISACRDAGYNRHAGTCQHLIIIGTCLRQLQILTRQSPAERSATCNTVSRALLAACPACVPKQQFR